MTLLNSQMLAMVLCKYEQFLREKLFLLRASSKCVDQTAPVCSLVSAFAVRSKERQYLNLQDQDLIMLSSK